ncbi:MAG: VWA domain-containing protein, partial [Gammaproteobacteria bacterium]
MYTSPANSVKHKRFRPLNAFAIGFLLSLVVSTPVVADDTEIFFSSTNSAVKPNVLFVLDTSGSMNWTDGQSQSRLNRMKEALTSILTNATNINVGLMRFNGSNGGGPVLFPLSYIDQDVCEIESCANSNTHSISVSVSQDSDDAEEATASGVVTLDSNELNLVEDATLSSVSEETIEISDNVNDTEERADGTLHTDSPDFDLFYVSGGNHAGAGIRFQNVTIPQGAIITKAEIVFTVKERGKGDLNMDIYGDAVDDSLQWSETTGQHVTDRTQTTAKVDWNNIENRNLNRTVTTPSLIPVVQEIVSRGGWTSGNDLAFMLFVDGTSDSKNYRRFYTFNSGGTARGPKLRVSYQPSAVGDDITQTVGLRFDNVNIPQGAAITNAYLEFEANEATSDTTNLTITAEVV